MSTIVRIRREKLIAYLDVIIADGGRAEYGLGLIQANYAQDGFGLVSLSTVYRDLRAVRNRGYFAWLDGGAIMVLRHHNGNGNDPQHIREGIA